MYQRLSGEATQVTGAPRYDGIEYDYEVPGGNVVSSPGGVSSTHHHWTKGFYGSGGVTADIYGGSGLRYPYGVMGNAYGPGYDASTQMGNYPPPPDFVPIANETLPVNDISAVRDNFEVIPGTTPEHVTAPADTVGTTPIPREMLETAKVSSPSQSDTSSSETKTEPKSGYTFTIKIHPVLILVLLVLAYLTIDAWGQAIKGGIQGRFFGGRSPPPKILFIMAIVLTVALFVLAYWFGVGVKKVI